MKKEKKEQWEKIVEEKERLEMNLGPFLYENKKKGYEVYEDLFQALQAVDTENLEMEYISEYIPICPYLKLDTRLHKSVGMAILYTYIGCKIYDERADYKCIPDTLMDEITAFKGLLEDFLFF